MRSSAAPQATSMTAPNPAQHASAAMSTSALSSDQSSCPCARTNACRCAWPLARFASVNATWSTTSALRCDSTAGCTHRLPTLHDSGPHDCSYLSNPMYDNLVCAFLADVDRFKSCYPAPSSSTIPAQNPSKHLLQFLILFLLFSPSIVNLFLVWRQVRSSLSMHGRRHWNLDVVWVGVGGQFTTVVMRLPSESG
jgi:hypothetical protein